MPEALLIIDHGSTHIEANRMLEDLAGLVREVKPELIVEVAHMELAEPTILQGYQACVEAGASEVIALPYMLSPGRHSTRDIPRLVEKAALNFPTIKYRVTESLGLHRKLVEVILERSKIDG